MNYRPSSVAGVEFGLRLTSSRDWSHFLPKTEEVVDEGIDSVLIWRLLHGPVALEETMRTVRMKGLYYKNLIAAAPQLQNAYAVSTANNCFEP
jgi:hypothetical protein